MWLNAAKKAFHFLSSINVELWTLRSVYVRTRACMCVCDQSRNLYCSLGVSSPALLSICCNVKRFLLSYWVIGTAKSMWTQKFTVSYGNNIKELDTIDRQWQCYYKNRLHVLSVKSKNTSLVCVSMCVHSARCYCSTLSFVFFLSVLWMVLLLLLQLFYGSVSCAHRKADQIDLCFLFIPFIGSYCIMVATFVCLFVWVTVCKCVFVCTCILICCTQFLMVFVFLSLSFFVFKFK